MNNIVNTKDSPNSFIQNALIDNAPTYWPKLKSIYDFLNYRPWITLPWSFDHDVVYDEVIKLIDRFQPHRNYDTDSTRKGRWMSLGIKTQNGHPNNSYAHTHYKEEPNYQLTEIANLCPQTMNMLNEVTNVSQCQRIRFMLLEPGAKIHVHTDSQGEDVTMAVNIAVNMPKGCDFWIGCQADGTHNKITQKIEIQPGQAFLLNNAKYHYVENNSDQPRFHIIVHGPIKFNDEQVLKAAQEQNGIDQSKVLINRLVAQKALYESPVTPKDKLFHRWLIAGMWTPFFPDNVKLLVLEDEIEDKALMRDALHYTTKASLFPFEHTTLTYKQLDQHLHHLKDQGVEYVIAVGAGTYTRNSATLISNCFTSICEMNKGNAIAMGHIIDRPDRSSGLPHFHEQFFILDLKGWDQIGRPALNSPYCHYQSTFPPYKRGECFHDDYTPKWVGNTDNTLDESSQESGVAGFATDFIAKTLRSNKTILNVPTYVRCEKSFSYPRAGYCWQLDEVKQEIKNRLSQASNKVFVFNNENLHAPLFQKMGQFKPQNFYSVAAGLKPFVLLQDIYKRTGVNPKINYFDFSLNALEYHKRLTTLTSKESLLQLFEEQLRDTYATQPDKAKRLAEENFSKVLNFYFNGSFEQFQNIYLHSNNSQTHVNLLTEPQKFIDSMDLSKSFLMWVSNIWTTNNALYSFTTEELDQNFKIFANLIGRKLNMNSWVIIKDGQHEAIIGHSKDQPFGVITCGYGYSLYDSFSQGTSRKNAGK